MPVGRLPVWMAVHSGLSRLVSEVASVGGSVAVCSRRPGSVVATVGGTVIVGGTVVVVDSPMAGDDGAALIDVVADEPPKTATATMTNTTAPRVTPATAIRRRR